MRAAGSLRDGEDDLGIGEDGGPWATDAELRAEARERVWDELTAEERASVVRHRRLR